MSINAVEEVKNRLNIAEIIGEYLKLERAGTNFKAKCPFHNEKTPSFFISPDRGTYYCFGCGEKGDVISFVQKFEGLDFVGAMKILADRAGVNFEPKHLNKEDKEDKTELYKILETAETFFRDNLKANTKVLNYLKERGLDEKDIEYWKIGFALPEWRSLKTDLNDRGIKDSELLKVGLIKQKENKAYDTFRSRIMFPINDSAGRVVGFSGRIFEGKDDEAKYLNSPETIVFKKSFILYGFDKAKFSIRKNNFAILVEGQFDLIMSHKAGFQNTVATSGTATTIDHLKIIKRLTNNLLVAYDSDKAGLSATKRVYALAVSLGMNVRSIQMEGGLDPADLVKESVEKWKEAIKNAEGVPELIFENLKSETNKDKLIRKLRTDLWPIIASLPQNSEKHRLISKLKLSLFTGMSEDFILEEINNATFNSTQFGQVESNGNSTVIKTPFPYSNSVKLFLAYILLKNKRPEILKEIKDILNDKFAEIEKQILDGKNELLFEIDNLFNAENEEQAFQDLYKRGMTEFLKLELENERRNLEYNKNDEEKHNLALNKCTEISKKLENLKSG